eukprot:6196829-Pleurochrysis_carterae.AAC.3
MSFTRLFTSTPAQCTRQRKQQHYGQVYCERASKGAPSYSFNHCARSFATERLQSDVFLDLQWLSSASKLDFCPLGKKYRSGLRL